MNFTGEFTFRPQFRIGAPSTFCYTRSMTSRTFQRAAGFTLIELLAVVMIIGILASLAVPQYYKTIERDKASEAVNLLMALKGAQDRYKTKYGAFCNGTIASCSGFDYDPPTLKYYGALPAFT